MKNILTTSLILITILNIYSSCGIAAIDSATGIKISNEINRIGDDGVQMIYKINTPKIIHYDFILALDSSGSFGETGSQSKAVLRDIPKFLSKIAKYYPDAYFNMSIISWDDNIDFAYDKKIGYITINKIEPLAYKLAPIENVTNDLNKLQVLYKSKQTESTDYSVPIKASLDIFNTPENRPKDPLHTMRFIMLVTGNGEYTPCKLDLLKEASDKAIGIYTVGLDIGTESELQNYLEDISNNTIHPTHPYSGLLSNSGFLSVPTEFEIELNNTLEKALKKHFDNIMNTSVADKIEISDRLYCYMKPDMDSLSIDTKKNNFIIRSQAAYSGIESNTLSDGTSEIRIEIPELLPNSTTTVAFNIKNTFDPMTLPVTVSERDGPMIVCSPIERAGPMLRYTWHVNNLEKVLPLGVATHGSDRLNIMSAKDTHFNETLRIESLGFIDMLKFALLSEGS